MQSLQLGYTISGAGLRVNNIHISMFPGGLWVQLLNDKGVSKWELYEPEVPSDGSSRPLTSMSGLGLARDGEAGPL